MHLISAQIPEKLYLSLCDMAKRLDRSSSSIIRRALIAYLEELQEDIEDYNDALEALKDKSPSIPLEEVIKELGFSKKFDLKNE